MTWYGPYPLTENDVSHYVDQPLAGAYLMVRIDPDARLFEKVMYAGRSDSDIRERLLDHAREGRYNHFRFQYASDPKEAYEMECRAYHEYKPPDNEHHPARPDGTDWLCSEFLCGH